MGGNSTIRPVDEPPGESRPLTGLRGLAALLVMLHHFYLHLALHEHLPLLRWLLQKGYMGVDLFFVLSGFVLCLAYATWFDGHRRVGPVDYLRFMARRIARLWPLHATVLLLVVATGTAFPGLAISSHMLLANLGLIQAWGLSAAINAPAWSISTEFMAYLLFPFLVPLCLRSRFGPWACLGVVALLLAFCMGVAPPLGPARRGWLDLYFNYSVLPLLRCLAGFILGMVVYRMQAWPPLRRLAATPWFGPVMLGAAVAMLLGRVNDLVTFAVLPLVVLGLHGGRGPVHRLLSSNPLHALGVLSYATYLIHFALLGVFPFGWAPLRFTLPIYVMVTLGLAALLHGLVERPGRRMMRACAESVLLLLFPAGRNRDPLRLPLQNGPR